MVLKSVLGAAGLMLCAGLAMAMVQLTQLDNDQLLDQNRRLTALASPRQITLVYFYRGDW